MDTETIKRELRIGKRALAAARALSNQVIADKFELPKATVTDIMYMGKNLNHPDAELILGLYNERLDDAELAERYTIGAIAERYGISEHRVRRIARKVHKEMLEEGEL